MPDKNWQFELEEYIKQGEPDKAEKSEAWQTAIGLQAVDGLNTSDYLLDTAKEHIEGKITIDEAQKRIHSYYEQRSVRTETENVTKEADIVSARIAKLLGEKAFQFSPAEWLSIHRRLFEGVFGHAGQVRQYNITKKEWVLNGDTVTYADWNSIKEIFDSVSIIDGKGEGCYISPIKNPAFSGGVFLLRSFIFYLSLVRQRPLSQFLRK